VAQQEHPAQRRTILSLSAGAFIRDLGNYVIWIILAIYLYDVRALTFLEVGAFYLLTGLLSAPVTISGGALLDRIGRRRVAVLLPWLLGLLSSLVFLLVFSDGNLYLLLGILLVMGPFQALSGVANQSILSDVTRGDERISGFSALRVASNAGIVVGLVAGGLLSEVSYAWVFLLSVAGYLTEGVIYFLHIPETLPSRAKAMDEAQSPLRSPPPHRNRLFLEISIFISITWLVVGMFESILTPLYMSSVNHFSNLEITGLFAINGLVVVGGQYLVNRGFQGFSDLGRTGIGLLFFGAGFVLFALSPLYLLAGIAVLILTIGEDIGSPASITLVTKLSPEDRRGAYLGFNSTISNLISPFRPLLAAATLSITLADPPVAWYGVAAACAILAALVPVMARRLARSFPPPGTK
jgi:MFS family permease